MPDGKTILSWQLSIVLNEFKSFLLIIGSDDMIYLTIAIFRWFSRQPSPLNGMVGGNLCVRWVSDGFGVPQLSCTDGFRWSSTIGQTMRCNGPSLQSSQVLETT